MDVGEDEGEGASEKERELRRGPAADGGCLIVRHHIAAGIIERRTSTVLTC